MEIAERKCSICGKNRECIKFIGKLSIPEKKRSDYDINILTKTFDVYICKECHKRIREEDLNETYKHEYFW